MPEVLTPRFTAAFTGDDNDPWLASQWTLHHVGSSLTDILTNRGRMVATGAGSFADPARATAIMSPVGENRVEYVVEIPDAEFHFSVYLRSSGAWNGAGQHMEEGYQLFVWRTGPGTVPGYQLWRMNGAGQAATQRVTNITFGDSSTTHARVRYEAIGNIVRASIVAGAATPFPSQWGFSVTDDVWDSGVLGTALRGPQNAGSNTVYVHSLQLWEVELQVELYHWHDVVVAAPSAVGNLFDVIADVDWTHETGVVRQGRAFYSGAGTDFVFRCGAEIEGAWTGVTSSAVTELDGLVIPIVVAPLTNPDRSGYHAHQPDHPAWWMQQKGPEGRAVRIAPRFVMWDAIQYMWDDVAREDTLLALLNGDYGWSGAHIPDIAHNWWDAEFEPTGGSDGSRELDQLLTTANPDVRTFTAIERLLDKWLDLGGYLHFWLYADNQRDGTAANYVDGANGVLAQRLDRYIAARLGPVPGWSCGYGFDNWENLSAAMVGDWVDRITTRMGWYHPVGARFVDVNTWPNGNIWSNCIDDVVRTGGFPECARAWNQARPWPSQFATWEQWWPQIVDAGAHTSTAQEIEDAIAGNAAAGRAFMPDRPHFSADRFRNASSGPVKDFASQDEVPAVVRGYGRAGWAAIYGQTITGAVLLPVPWTNDAAIKAANDEVTTAMDALPASPKPLSLPSQLLRFVS